MPKMKGPDGVEKEISPEEFQEMMRSGDAQVIGIQQIVTDQKTGKVVNKYNIPRNPDGSFDVFGGGLFGAMFGDHRSLEEKIADGEAGDEDTMEALAQLYLNGGLEADKDPEKAVYWFGKLAECGNSIAQFNLGLLYAKGHGVARDFTKAAYWMEQAAKNGDTDAPALVEKYRKAEAAQKKLPSGDAQAQADLAGVLMSLAGALEQVGKEKDYAEAFALAQKSAAQNNGDGLWALALAYEHGRGVEQNAQKAIECYRRGAELGHAPSQHSLACAYRCGDGVEENKTLAIELCRKSAAQGYVLAEMFLAKVYETGDGVKADPEQMLAWGEKAAAHGTPDIQYEVAKLYMYQRDDGKMIDAQRARYWLTQAAEGGHEMAQEMLNFSPMWAEEGIAVEGADRENDSMEAPMFRLFGIAMEYGLEEAMKGEEPTFEAVIAFVTALADSGNTEARDALDEFQAVLTRELGEPEAAEEMGDPLMEEALALLDAMRTEFHTQCWEWEQYPDEVYYRIKEIMSRNVKSLEDIEKNKPMATRYMEGVKQEIYRKRDQFYQSMKELEEKLTYFRDKDLDGETMNQLIEHFVQWVDYCRELPFRIGESGGSFAIPEVFLEKKRQWLGEEQEEKPAE